jgi:hypothetical protein
MTASFVKFIPDTESKYLLYLKTELILQVSRNN